MSSYATVFCARCGRSEAGYVLDALPPSTCADFLLEEAVVACAFEVACDVACEAVALETVAVCFRCVPSGGLPGAGATGAATETSGATAAAGGLPATFAESVSAMRGAVATAAAIFDDAGMFCDSDAS